MGLDQSAYTKESYAGDSARQELMYWRKHNRLQGWMQRLWKHRGGIGDFNCKELRLTMDDLDDLEAAIKNKKLPKTSGFFFGNDSYEEYDHSEWGYKEADRIFITKARIAIEDGLEVYYNCWW